MSTESKSIGPRIYRPSSRKLWQARIEEIQILGILPSGDDSNDLHKSKRNTHRGVSGNHPALTWILDNENRRQEFPRDTTSAGLLARLIAAPKQVGSRSP